MHEIFDLSMPVVIDDLVKDSVSRNNYSIHLADEYLKCIKRVEQVLPENEKLAKIKDEVDREHRNIKKGFDGEETARFILKNSYMPMYILSDILLKDELDSDKNAQIDILVITRKSIYVVECKNWSGEFFVDKKGNFNRIRKNGLVGEANSYAQDERHFRNVKYRMQNDLSFPNDIDTNRLHFVVAFTNPKMTLVVDESTPERIDSTLIKADMLNDYIQTIDNQSNNAEMSDKQMKELSDYFYNHSCSERKNYLQKYNWIKKLAVGLDAYRIVSSVLLISTILFFVFYFGHFQIPQLLIGFKNYDLWLMTRSLFMIFSPVGIAVGVIGFVSGSKILTGNIIAKCACYSIFFINGLSIAWSVYIDKPDSILEIIIGVITATIICLIWNVVGLITYLISLSISKFLYKFIKRRISARVTL